MMKRYLLAIATLIAATQASAGVGVSVNIGEPGFFGQIEVGDSYPRPEVIYAQPRIVQRGPAVEAPIYLRVPPDHAKHWKHYCDRYNACGRPVYFVQDNWYNNVYAPTYREHREHAGPEGHWDEHHDQGHDHGNGPRGHDDGPGRDHDHGHDDHH